MVTITRPEDFEAVLQHAMEVMVAEVWVRRGQMQMTRGWQVAAGSEARHSPYGSREEQRYGGEKEYGYRCGIS